MSKIGVPGSRVVGETLANGFLNHDHEVVRGSREPAKLPDWTKGAGSNAQVGTPTLHVSERSWCSP